MIDDKQPKLSVQYVQQLLFLEINNTSTKSNDNPLTTQRLLKFGGHVMWEAGRIEEALILYAFTFTGGTKAPSSIIKQMIQGYVGMGQYNTAYSLYLQHCSSASGCLNEGMLNEIKLNAMDEVEARKQLSSSLPIITANKEECLDVARLSYALAPENTKLEMAVELIKRLQWALSTDKDNNILVDEIHDILKEESEASSMKTSTAALTLHIMWAEFLFDKNVKNDKNITTKVHSISASVDNNIGHLDYDFTSLFLPLNATSNVHEEKNIFSMLNHEIQQRLSIRVRSLRLFAQTKLQLVLTDKEKKELMDTFSSRKNIVVLDHDLLQMAVSTALELGQLSVASNFLYSVLNVDSTMQQRNEIISIGCRLGHVYINNDYVNESHEVLQWLEQLTVEQERIQQETQVTINIFKARVYHALQRYQDAIDLLLHHIHVPSLQDNETLSTNTKVSQWKLQKLSSFDAMGYYTLGRCYRSLGGRYTILAAWSFRQSMLQMEGTEGAGKKNVDPVVPSATMSDVGEIAFQLGSTLLEANRYTEALNYLKLATSKRPLHTPTLNNLGVLHLRMGKITEAKRIMKHALSIQDGCMNRFNLGVLLQEHTRSWRNSVVQYREALKLCGYSSGSSNSNDGDDGLLYDGIKTFNKEVDVVQLYTRLAKVLTFGDQFNNALQMLEQTMYILKERSLHQETSLLFASRNKSSITSQWRQTNLTTMETLFQMSTLLSSMGQHHNALINVQKARALSLYLFEENSVEQIQSLIELGNAYLHAGHLQTAQKHYEQVLLLDPTHSTGLNNYGVVLYRLNNYSGAYEVFSKMLRMNHRDKRAINMMKQLPKHILVQKRRNSVHGSSSSSILGNLFGALSAE